jgi:hypothetical protein
LKPFVNKEKRGFGQPPDLGEVVHPAAVPSRPPELDQGLLIEKSGGDGPTEVGDGLVRIVPDAEDPPQTEMGFGIVRR